MKTSTSNIKNCTHLVAPITGTTPQRSVEAYYKAGHRDASTERRKKCKGRALQLVESHKGGTKYSCQVCAANGIQNKAEVVCSVCKGYFCGKKHCMGEGEEDYGAFYTGRMINEKRKNREGEGGKRGKKVKELVYFYRSCFDVSHDNARSTDTIIDSHE